MSRPVPRGLVENEVRQSLARALMRSGPLTAQRLAKDTEHPVAFLDYHLRALALAGAVAPSLRVEADDDEVAWALTADNLTERAREVLLGEVKDLPRFGPGNRPDRISDLPEWFTRPRDSTYPDLPQDETDDSR